MKKLLFILAILFFAAPAIRIDGLEVYRWNGAIPSVPMRVIFQFAIAGKEPAGPPVDDSIFPVYLEVDYIRVCP